MVSKPRNFYAKNIRNAGRPGAMKDRKRASKLVRGTKHKANN